MFGEYALYADGKTVALICGDTLYVKIVPASVSLRNLCEQDSPYPGAKPYYSVSDDLLSSIESLPSILRAIARSLPEKSAVMRYSTYILECADGTLYCGSTNDLSRRLAAHNGLKAGARYTKARRPVILRHEERFLTFREARQREKEIQSWPRAKKLALIASRRVREKAP